MNELITYAREVGTKYPAQQSHIEGLIELCQAEIEDGESEENEISLCYNDLKEIEDNNEEKA